MRPDFIDFFCSTSRHQPVGSGARSGILPQVTIVVRTADHGTSTSVLVPPAWLPPVSAAVQETCPRGWVRRVLFVKYSRAWSGSRQAAVAAHRGTKGQTPAGPMKGPGRRHARGRPQQINRLAHWPAQFSKCVGSSVFTPGSAVSFACSASPAGVARRASRSAFLVLLGVVCDRPLYRGVERSLRTRKGFPCRRLVFVPERCEKGLNSCRGERHRVKCRQPPPGFLPG